MSPLCSQLTLTPHYNTDSPINQNGSPNPKFGPGNHPDTNAVLMPSVVPNIITDDLIDPVLLRDGRVVQQIPSAQTIVNSRDPGLCPSADENCPLLSILPTPNPNPGSQYSAIANWDQLLTHPQTRIPNDLPAGVIANTAAQEQAAPQMTVNTTHPTPNPDPGSGHSAGANWDQLSTLPQTRICNDLPVSVIANTVA